MPAKLTLDMLNDYTEDVRELDFLLRKKEFIKEKISALKSPDYGKSRVTSGNGTRTSEQEHYVIALEKINNKIEQCKMRILPEHEFIKKSIAAVKKWQYRRLLVYRYLEKWKWAQIIEEFFEFEEDYDEEKNFKYKEKILYWHRQALKALVED